MLTRGKVVAAIAAVLVVALAYTAWQVWRVQRDLTAANDAVTRLQAGVEANDVELRQAALGDLRVSAAQARNHSDGPWLGLLTYLPLVGDDVTGVRALAGSLDTVAAGGIQPLADTVDSLDDIATGGRVDLEAVRDLQEPVRRASEAFGRAHDQVAELDSSGYAGILRTRFEDYVEQVAELDQGAASAASATEVLPDLLGGEGVKDYLLIFQNNAEIRATGGLPGSWARVRAEDGALRIAQQGSGAQFPRLEESILPLSPAEDTVYTDLLGVFWLDANFTPDFPRSANLWRAHFESVYAPTQLDGVLSLDPVALSYLLAGTGPVTVGGVTLTPENAVQQLLNEPYLTLDPTAQDAFFATAAAAIFDAASSDLASPLDFVRGFTRAADEGRFLMQSYDDAVEPALADSNIRGALASDDGTSPHVEIGLNDATGSKMSYYLRYRARVSSQSCEPGQAGTQSLLGSMTLNQTIASADAQQLPESVTGPGIFGTAKGLQTVALRIYGPTGGDISQVSIDGAAVDVDVVELDGRPVATTVVQLSGPEDVLVNWSMQTGPGQTGDGTTGVTPSVIEGSKNSTFASSC